jgi:hypothetical protein
MKPEVSPSKQNKKIQILSLITMILLLISFLWLFYKIYAYHEISEGVSSYYMYIGIATGNFLKIILLLFLGIFLYFAFENNLKIKVLAYFTFVAGFFTIFWIVFDWVALQNILKHKSDTSLEWSSLRIGLIINYIFYFIGFITLIKVRRDVRPSLTKRKSITDEVTFEVVQYIGIVCSSIGLGLVLFVSLFLNQYLHLTTRFDTEILYFFYFVIFLPYIAIILYWIIRLVREKNPTIGDEKQKHDLTMAGLVTWLLSFPGVVFLLVINNGRMEVLSKLVDLPLYLFATLLIFSISALRNFKKT